MKRLAETDQTQILVQDTDAASEPVDPRTIAAEIESFNNFSNDFSEASPPSQELPPPPKPEQHSRRNWIALGAGVAGLATTVALATGCGKQSSSASAENVGAQGSSQTLTDHVSGRFKDLCNDNPGLARELTREASVADGLPAGYFNNCDSNIDPNSQAAETFGTVNNSGYHFVFHKGNDLTKFITIGVQKNKLGGNASDVAYEAQTHPDSSEEFKAGGLSCVAYKGSQVGVGMVTECDGPGNEAVLSLAGDKIGGLKLENGFAIDSQAGQQAWAKLRGPIKRVIGTAARHFAFKSIGASASGSTGSEAPSGLNAPTTEPKASDSSGLPKGYEGKVQPSDNLCKTLDQAIQKAVANMDAPFPNGHKCIENPTADKYQEYWPDGGETKPAESAAFVYGPGIKVDGKVEHLRYVWAGVYPDYEAMTTSEYGDSRFDFAVEDLNTDSTHSLQGGGGLPELTAGKYGDSILIHPPQAAVGKHGAQGVDISIQLNNPAKVDNNAFADGIFGSQKLINEFVGHSLKKAE
jgi:hypothetical protein